MKANAMKANTVEYLLHLASFTSRGQDPEDIYQIRLDPLSLLNEMPRVLEFVHIRQLPDNKRQQQEVYDDIPIGLSDSDRHRIEQQISHRQRQALIEAKRIYLTNESAVKALHHQTEAIVYGHSGQYKVVACETIYAEKVTTQCRTLAKPTDLEQARKIAYDACETRPSYGDVQQL